MTPHTPIYPMNYNNFQAFNKAFFMRNLIKCDSLAYILSFEI